MLLSILGQLAGRLPILLVLLAGIIMLAARRQSLPKKAAALGIAGLVVIGAATIIGLAWSMWLPQLSYEFGMSSTEFSTILLVVGLALSLFDALGIGLLVAAVVVRPKAPAQQFGGFGVPAGAPQVPPQQPAAPDAQQAQGWPAP